MLAGVLRKFMRSKRAVSELRRVDERLQSIVAEGWHGVESFMQSNVLGVISQKAWRDGQKTTQAV